MQRYSIIYRYTNYKESFYAQFRNLNLKCILTKINIRIVFSVCICKRKIVWQIDITKDRLVWNWAVTQTRANLLLARLEFRGFLCPTDKKKLFQHENTRIPRMHLAYRDFYITSHSNLSLSTPLASPPKGINGSVLVSSRDRYAFDFHAETNRTCDTRATSYDEIIHTYII